MLPHYRGKFEKKQNDLESITFTKTFCQILVLLTFYRQMDAKIN